MSQLGATQKELLQIAQSNFPITHDPYAELSQAVAANSGVEVSGDACFAIIQGLRSDGFVRRMGPIFDSYKLGYVSMLCAVAVPDARSLAVADFINSFYNVTHNYLRENKYNIWFTVIAQGDDELQRIVSAIEGFAGSAVLQLPALRLFKIKVDFNIKREVRTVIRQKTTVPRKVTPTPITQDDKAIIRVAQSSSFAARHPYLDIAKEASSAADKTISEQQIMDSLRAWKDNGTIRRFGLTLKHHKVGFRFNVMGVWDVDDADVEIAGEIMAKQDEVSHCYERPRVATWQSNLYTMIHGRSREECDAAIASIKAALAAGFVTVAEPQKLYTLRELKKQSMRYFCEDSFG